MELKIGRWIVVAGLLCCCISILVSAIMVYSQETPTPEYITYTTTDISPKMKQLDTFLTNGGDIKVECEIVETNEDKLVKEHIDYVCLCGIHDIDTCIESHADFYNIDIDKFNKCSKCIRNDEYFQIEVEEAAKRCDCFFGCHDILGYNNCDSGSWLEITRNCNGENSNLLRITEEQAKIIAIEKGCLIPSKIVKRNKEVCTATLTNERMVD